MFRVEAADLLAEFNENLSLQLGGLRLLNVYDLFGFSDELLDKCMYRVFGEAVTDEVSTSFDLEIYRGGIYPRTVRPAGLLRR